MPTYKYPLIAQEGWPLLALILALTIGLTTWAPWLSIPGWLVFFTLMYLFRDPHREVPALPLAIVSPVHATVVAVGVTRDPWLDRDALQVLLDVAYHNVYTLRSPTEGKLIREFCRTCEPESGLAEPKRQSAYWIQTDEGDDVAISIQPGRFPSRLRYYGHAGERVGQGQRCGYLYLGGKVSVYLPVGSRTELEVGQQVVGGSSVLGHLVHNQPVSAHTFGATDLKRINKDG